MLSARYLSCRNNTRQNKQQDNKFVEARVALEKWKLYHLPQHLNKAALKSRCNLKNKLSHADKKKLLNHLGFSAWDDFLSSLWEKHKAQIKASEKRRVYDAACVFWWVELTKQRYSLLTIRQAQKKLLNDGLLIQDLTEDERKALRQETANKAMYEEHGIGVVRGINDPIHNANHKELLRKDYNRIFFTNHGATHNGGEPRKISLRRVQELYKEGKEKAIDCSDVVYVLDSRIYK